MLIIVKIEKKLKSDATAKPEADERLMTSPSKM